MKPLLLVVDDDRITRHLLAYHLRTGGEFDVVMCAGGKEAMNMLVSTPLFAVITDCSMPEMDGFQLARSIRELEAVRRLSRTPIIG